ncbi:MAG TPA: hypothetical protein ENL08_00335 [Bacteroidetes bacterium]|nr:hypothetical protein [Bacteroidota bacterium]
MGRDVQERIFPGAERILVMSQGMADLYRRKYNLLSTPLVHSLPEPIPADIQTETPDNTGFWGGAVYDINDRSVVRISNALSSIRGYRLFIACNDNREQLVRRGLDESGFILKYITEREAYLDTLRRQAFLVLALNWPDETATHEDELSTIFPTKTVEYLASGRPILVHCPEDYFLARFFRDHECAEVVTERSIDAIGEAVLKLIADGEYAASLARKALKAAEMFRLERVAGQFHDLVEETMHGLKQG